MNIILLIPAFMRQVVYLRIGAVCVK